MLSLSLSLSHLSPSLRLRRSITPFARASRRRPRPQERAPAARRGRGAAWHGPVRHLGQEGQGKPLWDVYGPEAHGIQRVGWVSQGMAAGQGKPLWDVYGPEAHGIQRVGWVSQGMAAGQGKPLWDVYGPEAHGIQRVGWVSQGMAAGQGKPLWDVYGPQAHGIQRVGWVSQGMAAGFDARIAEGRRWCCFRPLGNPAGVHESLPEVALRRKKNVVVVVVVVAVVTDYLFLEFSPPRPGPQDCFCVSGRFLTARAVPEAPGSRKLRKTFVVFSCVLVV